jgi:hypothetical protein
MLVGRVSQRGRIDRLLGDARDIGAPTSTCGGKAGDELGRTDPERTSTRRRAGGERAREFDVMIFVPT